MNRISLSVLVLLALVAGIVGAQDSYELTIMHTNDVHGHHEPQRSGDGGAARQATVVQQIRAEGGNSLLLDAGDRFTGTLFHVQYRGQDSVQIMNAIGYDAIVLGNHEFNEGSEKLAEFVQGLNFPTVSANIDFNEDPYLAGLVAPSVVLDVGGESIGIIGLTAPETVILNLPSKDLVFHDNLAEITQEQVDSLSAQGIDKIILLSHLGYGPDLEVAQAVSGVDIVVGGHTNTFLSNTYSGALGGYPTVLESASGEPTLVVQADTKTIYLGRLDVEFDGAGILTDWDGDAILLSRYISPDPEVGGLIAGLAEPIAELTSQRVGETSVALTGTSPRLCRIEECLLGVVITDAVLENTGADIVIQNGGGIRADIDEGEVTLGEVLNVLPFGNLISTLELTGADVLAALENGVSQVEVDENGNPMVDGAAGRFPQVAGMRYTFDATQEAGSRIVSAEVLMDGDYSALDMEAIYRVATNDYMRSGGDGYAILETNAINPYDQGSPLDQVVADYIAANSPLNAALEGRITHQAGG
ncbi:MAG: 5'-nucleotidase C-terminal domain-containing protein [Chloroflexota bacterium]|nr:5'-nucleotidase C-terminal domain-containing protein [Chloroflexota bacterium]MDE2947254.1 5'-nucleotidase C-terminal domain-containing protein [Chloroflexota bacterium]